MLITLPCLILGGSNKEGRVGSQHRFLKVGGGVVEGHNKVTFRTSNNFIGKMGGWELG